MLSCSKTSAGIHHPNDYHVDADLQILSPPVPETSGTSMEALSSFLHPSQTSSAARHPRRLGRADILVMASTSEAASHSRACNHLCFKVQALSIQTSHNCHFDHEWNGHRRLPLQDVWLVAGKGFSC